MKKLNVLNLSLLLVLSSWIMPEVSVANMLNFEAFNHPISKKAMFVGKKKAFSFDDVSLDFDTINGTASIYGDVTHIMSGEKWKLAGSWSNIDTIGNWQGGAVPYENMFDLLLATGKGKIVFKEVKLALTTDVINPVYQGPTQWQGKGKPNLVVKRRRLAGDYRLVVNGWLMGQDQNGKNYQQDWKFAFEESDEPINPSVPEPATMTLVAGGMFASAYMRKKKKA